MIATLRVREPQWNMIGWLAFIVFTFLCLSGPAQSAEPVTGPQWHLNCVDSSSLNPPIVSGQYIKQEGHGFTLGGKPFYGWGCNVGPWFIVADHDQVAEGIKRISRVCNCVRLHHLDSFRFPNLYARSHAGSPAHPLQRTYKTTEFDDVYLEKLDWVIACCKQHNVRVWVDVWNMRQLTAADKPAAIAAGVKCWDLLFSDPQRTKSADGSIGQGEMYGYFFVDDGLQELVRQQCIAMANLTNRYTGKRYGDEETIGWWMAANEKDFSGHGFHKWPKSPVTNLYGALWQAKWDAFGLDCPAEWKRNLSLFCAHSEYTAFQKLATALRSNTKHCIIAGGWWGNNPLLSLASLAATGDAIDVHIYSRDRWTWTAPDGRTFPQPNRMSSSCDPRTWATFETLLAGSHVAGRALTISEWSPNCQIDNARESPADSVDAVRTCADAMIRQDVSAAFFFMVYQSPVFGVRNEKYDWGQDDAVMLALAEAGRKFRTADRTPGTPGQVRAERLQPLSENELFGAYNWAANGDFSQGSAHTSYWVRDNTLAGLRTRMRLPSQAKLPWLGK